MRDSLPAPPTAAPSVGRLGLRPLPPAPQDAAKRHAMLLSLAELMRAEGFSAMYPGAAAVGFTFDEVKAAIAAAAAEAGR